MMNPTYFLQCCTIKETDITPAFPQKGPIHKNNKNKYQQINLGIKP